MKNMKKGFTLIELLIVIAIIGILAGVILVSTSSARSKADIAAYKSETAGAIPGLIILCHTAILGGASLPPTSSHTVGVIPAGLGDTTATCSPTGSGQWTVTTQPIKSDVT